VPHEPARAFGLLSPVGWLGLAFSTYMREQFKEGVANAAQYLGVNSAFRTCWDTRLLILCYHGVVRDEDLRDPVLYGNAIGVSEFARQIGELMRLFHPISASQLRDWLACNGSVPRNPMLVTFDDGYLNNLMYAAPVLQRFGVPAIINVCAGHIGTKQLLWPDEIHWRVVFWPKRFIPVPDAPRERRMPGGFSERIALARELRERSKHLPQEKVTHYLGQLREYKMPEPSDEIFGFLSWDEVRALKHLGFEIGSHTMDHPILSHLDREQVERELRNSKRIIEEHIDCECSHFAYPNGGYQDVSPKVVEEVRSAGYSVAFMATNRLASTDDDPLLLDRVYIPSGTSLASFHSRVSGFHGFLKRWISA